jgi:hypothetical protein
VKRVSLLPHRNDWTEIQRDAVTMLECHIANRGSWRCGDVERTPLTLSHIQWWLRKTVARRSGRGYAREVLATLVEMELLKDTGKVLLPRRQPCRSSHSYWWRIFEVLPITRLKAGAPASLDSISLGSRRVTVSLRGFLIRQGVIRRRSTPARGSIQWAFLHSGPP